MQIQRQSDQFPGRVSDSRKSMPRSGVDHWGLYPGVGEGDLQKKFAAIPSGAPSVWDWMPQ